jgi:hypothetical protein
MIQEQKLDLKLIRFVIYNENPTKIYNEKAFRYE